MPKKEYSVELTKMLNQLNDPNVYSQVPGTKRLKDLNEAEREIFMKVLKRKSKADRKKLQELMKGIDL